MPNSPEYITALESRFKTLKAKGRSTLSSTEKQELILIFEKLEAERIAQHHILPYGVNLLKVRYENKCWGCGKRLKIGHWMKYVAKKRGCYCLGCNPGQTSSIRSKKIPLDKLDDYLSS